MKKTHFTVYLTLTFINKYMSLCFNTNNPPWTNSYILDHSNLQNMFRAPPKPDRKYVEENGLAAMLANNRSAGAAPEMNLRECVIWILLPSTNKAAHSGFETQRRHHQKSKTGVSVAPQKGLMTSKNFFLKISRICDKVVLKITVKNGK